jgi:hypothetical protein
MTEGRRADRRECGVPKEAPTTAALASARPPPSGVSSHLLNRQLKPNDNNVGLGSYPDIRGQASDISFVPRMQTFMGLPEPDGSVVDAEWPACQPPRRGYQAG